jgi:copper(I)-binding protein
MLLLFVAGLASASASDIEVEGAWVREAPPGMPMLAGYMVVENRTGKDLVMTGASSSAFGAIEMHHTVIKDGMASMVRQRSIKIPARSKFRFEPKGYHLMLMQPKNELRQGDRVKITLKFSNDRSVVESFPVRKSGGEMMHHHDGHHEEHRKEMDERHHENHEHPMDHHK